MNAKKIMGAVLVALLAAALFVGAGAAADSKTDLGTVFVYQTVPGLTGTWTMGANTLIATPDGNGNGYFSGDKVAEGTYENATCMITVKYPTATITGVAGSGANAYMFIDGTLYSGTSAKITVISASENVAVDKVAVTTPAGNVVAWTLTNGEYTLPTLSSGKYQLQAHFKNDNMTTATPANYLYSTAVYTFTVASSGDVTITAAADTVIEQNVVAITVAGEPGEPYKVNFGTNFEYSSDGLLGGQKNTDGTYDFTMPNTGKATIYAKAIKTGTGKISVVGEDVSVSIKVEKGTITAETDKASYFIGDAVEISGTSTVTSTLYFYIAGTNIALSELNGVTTSVEEGKWVVEIESSKLLKKDGSKLDAGTYTVYVSPVPVADITDANGDLKVEKFNGKYATVSLVLKQPFISITKAPAVAVQGTAFAVSGTAEATDALQIYVFGTNFFAATGATFDFPSGSQTLPATGIFDGKTIVEFDQNEFTVKFDVPKTMAAGQYFMVIQHPMYDEFFNIFNYGGNFFLVSDPTSPTANPEALFNVTERQTANAAQALCDELDAQKIDDMYVKLSFIVDGPKSEINPIPSEITKGSKLTVSGTTNLGEGKTVVVELLSTAFAAVPKETVGSASFISLTTKTDENGNWEITFDTTGLNVDEYTLSVAVDALTSTTAKVNIIEGAPTEQPTTTPTTQPTQTEQPTETPVQTPGFGALAALAGLGAVAVLLLRRE